MMLRVLAFLMGVAHVVAALLACCHQWMPDAFAFGVFLGGCNMFDIAFRICADCKLSIELES